MNPCHTTIYKTNQPIGEARLVVVENEPTFTAYGGYHDAGDADRRTYHMDVTASLLTTYEAFPQLLTDEQYNIPDKFDEKYNILGKGSGASSPSIRACVFPQPSTRCWRRAANGTKPRTRSPCHRSESM